MNNIKNLYKRSFIVVNTNLKFVYVKIPKAACSGILHTLLPTFNINECNNLDIHGIINKYSKENKIVLLHKIEDYKEVRNVLFGKDYFKFTCIRHPVERFISAFYNKIILYDKTYQLIDFCVEFIELSKQKSNEEVFIALLEKIKSLPDNKREPHFRSQLSLSLDNYIKYDHVFTTNNITENYHIIQSKFPLTKNLQVHNKLLLDDVLLKEKNYLMEKYKNKIKEIYSSDYNLYLKYIK